MDAKCVRISGMEIPYFYLPVGSFAAAASGKESIVQT